MKLYLSTFISFLLLSSPLFGQSERPETIIIPVSSMGDVSDTRKKIIQNTLTQELSKHFQILPQDRFEQVQEQVFNELEYDECTEDQCIMRIQEILQIENLFHLEVIGEEGDTQLNLKWINLDEKRNRVDYCEGCKTNELRKRVVGLVEKLVGEKPIVVRVVRKEKGILFRDTPYTKFFEGGEKWIKFGDEETQVKFEGEIVDGVPNGEGTENYPNGQKYVGEFKDGLPNGQVTYTSPNGEKYMGEFKDGKRHGQGTYTFPDGRKYVGEWKNGEYTGQGTLTWFNGDKYVGEFKDGDPNGQGTFTFSDGRKYVGEWKDGNQWNGTSYNTNGNIIDNYVNGVIQ